VVLQLLLHQSDAWWDPPSSFDFDDLRQDLRHLRAFPLFHSRASLIVWTRKQAEGSLSSLESEEDLPDFREKLPARHGTMYYRLKKLRTRLEQDNFHQPAATYYVEQAGLFQTNKQTNIAMIVVCVGDGRLLVLLYRVPYAFGRVIRHGRNQHCGAIWISFPCPS